MIRGFLTNHSGTATGSSQTLITATGNTRTFFYIQNLGAAVMNIVFGAPGGAVPTATATTGFQLAAKGTEGDRIQFDHFVPQGSVALIGTSTQAFLCYSAGE